MSLPERSSGDTTRTARLFDLDERTDDTAPDYDGLTVAYTTVVSTILVAATVGIVWLLEDTVVGEAADAGFGTAGTGSYGLVWLGVFVLMLVVSAVGRYLGVRAIDTRNDYLLVGVTAVQVIAVGVLLTVALELYVGLVSNRLLWILTGAAVGLAALGNLLVLATDWDFSWAASVSVKILYAILLAVGVSIFVWFESTDGALWQLYLWIWAGILWVGFPLYLLVMYIHDVWRISSAENPPTVGALASYTAITGLLLLPLEVFYGFALALAEAAKAE